MKPTPFRKRVTKPKQKIRLPPVSKKQKKVKVLFVCDLGEQASVRRRMEFAGRLKAMGLRNLFELNSAGVYNFKPVQLKELLLRQDYIVTCTGHANSTVKKALGKTEKPLLSISSSSSSAKLCNTLLTKIPKAQEIKIPRKKKQ